MDVDQVNEIFKPQYVKINKELKDKNEALKYLACLGYELSVVENFNQVYKELIEREEEFSTGFGDGFAIPHAKSTLVKTASIFVIKTLNPVEWEAIDDKAVNIIIGLLVPYECRGDMHLSLLAKLSANLMEDEFKNNLKEANSEEVIYKLVSEILESEA